MAAPVTARMVEEASTVRLNVYDVVDHPFNYKIGKWLSLGIHHSGIQIDEREFAFTLEGIVVTEPHRIPRCVLTHQMVLTRTASHEMVRAALQVLQRRFTAMNYDPLTHNCNRFSDAFCALLECRAVPGWVNRAPSFAAATGTRFRLRPPRVTAPSVEWSLALAEAATGTRSLRASTVVLSRVDAPADGPGGPDDSPRVPSPRSFGPPVPPAWAAALADDDVLEVSTITAPWRPGV